MPAFLDVVDLNGLVAFGGHEKLARVVKVEGQYVGLRAAILDVVSLEQLHHSQNSLIQREQLQVSPYFCRAKC